MENFSPSNEEYKKVEDLPKNEQHRFANFDDGFVTKQAFDNFENSKKMAFFNSERRGLFDKIFHRNEPTETDSLFSEADSMNNDFDNAILMERKRERIIKYRKEQFEKLKNSHKEFEEKPDDEKIVFFDKISTLFSAVVKDEAKIIIEGEAREKMKKLGHEGLLFLSDCHDNRCQALEGSFDGQKIKVHSKIGGDVGGTSLSKEEALVIFGTYCTAAIDLTEHYNSFDNFLKSRDVIEKYLGREMWYKETLAYLEVMNATCGQIKMRIMVEQMKKSEQDKLLAEETMLRKLKDFLPR